MHERPKTKAAKDIRVGDWCEFASLGWQVTDTDTNDQGYILIEWGNCSISVFHPNERIRMQYDT